MLQTWDLIKSSGAITCNATSGSPTIINIDDIGTTNFNTCNSYTWTLAQGTSIVGFAANDFVDHRSLGALSTALF